MEVTLVVPSAKLVPEELRQIGKLPGIIYPINQKIVFDYLYNKYKNIVSTMDILCKEGADKVRQGLARYSDERIRIRELPRPGDLGYTVYFGLMQAKTPVILNFADTIVMDEMPKPSWDAFYYSEDYLSETWTYFEEEAGVITKVYDKIPVHSKRRKKLFVGLFVFQDVSDMIRCLEEAFAKENRQMSTFYEALCLYSRRHPMKAIPARDWFDIGHADTYQNSRLEVRAREFNHISVDKDRGILKKTSDDKEKFLGEIQWYLKLPADVEYVRPRIFSYSTAYEKPYISMEYYAYHTVHELFLYGDLNYHQWEEIFLRIRFVCRDFKRYQVQDAKIREALEDVYLTKTLQRLGRMKKEKEFRPFFERPIAVNGVVYKSLEDISEILKIHIPRMLYDVESFPIVHGDLCFANIMVDDNFSFIKLIDPRGKFGAFDIYGDFRYELAKLFHSVDGKYDFIIKDLFYVDQKMTGEGYIDLRYTIFERKQDFDLYKIFTEIFQEEIGEDLEKIELLEALLFLSMIPLHRENRKHQIAMLCTGLEILDRVIDIRSGQNRSEENA